MTRHLFAILTLALSIGLWAGASGEALAYSQAGVASYYWQPQMTASGERFNPNAMTAAHKTLPIGTRVRVTHRASGRSVVVRINDRGPFIKGRIIDLSRAAAGQLGMRSAGLAKVTITVIGRGGGKQKVERGAKARTKATSVRIASRAKRRTTTAARQRVKTVVVAAAAVKRSGAITAIR